LAMRNSGLIDPTNKILFHLERLQSFLRGEAVYPISVEMDLSDCCNLKCLWCRFSKSHNPTIMPYWLAEKILKELAEVGVKSIVYSGGGEPLLNPQFKEIADLGHSLGLDQGIYTNGVYVHKYVETLNQKMKFVYISLDAATRETFLKSKGSDLFDQVLGNISLLCRHKDKATIGLGFLVSPGNEHEIGFFTEFLDAFGVDYIQFRPAVTENIDKKWLRQVMKALSEYREVHGIFIADYKFNDLLRENGGRTYSKCLGHNFLGGISADGTVWLCLNKRHHKGFDVGNLKVQSFKEVWNGERRREAIQKINLDDCMRLCRPHELNKFLNHIVKGNPHSSFL